MYRFNLISPIESEESVWSLQQFLLKEAESLIGKKADDKIVFQPTFEDTGPFIRNRPCGDGAWAVLSLNAKDYWPTTLYELAHETIHLLNPVRGSTNYLEEGIAVAFSIHMSKKYAIDPMYPTDIHYQKSLKLVHELPDGIYKSAKKIRNKCGSLGNATVEDLMKLFPKTNLESLNELCTIFSC